LKEGFARDLESLRNLRVLECESPPGWSDAKEGKSASTSPVPFLFINAVGAAATGLALLTMLLQPRGPCTDVGVGGEESSCDLRSDDAMDVVEEEPAAGADVATEFGAPADAPEDFHPPEPAGNSETAELETSSPKCSRFIDGKLTGLGTGIAGARTVAVRDERRPKIDKGSART
jgi:hypothetical protein